MNSGTKRFVMILAAVLFAVSLHGLAAQDGTEQGDPSPLEIGRYEVSAFGPTPERRGHGYYILDTATGSLWSNYGNEQPRLISGPLNE